MYKGYVRKDVFFSTRLQEFFLITDKDVTVQSVISECSSNSSVKVFSYGDYIIIETDEKAFALYHNPGIIMETPYKTEDDETVESEIHNKAKQDKKIPALTFAGSDRFVSVTLVLIILFTLINNSLVSAVSGTLSDSQADISPIDGVHFTTGAGTVAVNPAYADHSSGELGFTLLDPRPLGQTLHVRHQAVPAGLNPRFIEAVLMYRKAHSLAEIQRLTGLSVTQAQLDAATQLSLWKHVLTISGNFHVQEASVQDAVVRSLSTQIDTWARGQLAVIAQRTALTEAILPVPSPTLNTAGVSQTQEGASTRIGPYTFFSNPIITLDISVTQGVILDAAGQVISQVTTSQPFYVVLPQHVTGVQTVRLSGEGREYQLAHSHGRVWLHPTKKNITLQYNVGGQAGVTGAVEVTVLDSLTGLPMNNIHALVRTPSANLGTMRSNENGVMSHEVPVGTFWIDITSPQGFLEHPPFPMTVGFLGDVQTMIITLKRTEAVVDFSIIDINTFGVLGYAEAFLYKDSRPYRRFAFTNGRVNGVLLNPGNYSISVYDTTQNYSISGQIPFMVEAGTNIEIAIPLTPNAPVTTIRLENTMNRNNWIFNFHRGSEFLFELPNNGMVQLRFPYGSDIQVIARSSDGTVHLPPFNFTTGIHDIEVMIPVVTGTETVTFNIVDNQIQAPIPYIIMGLFDQNHNLLDVRTADNQGVVRFAGLVYGSVYYINVIGAPPEVSGYSANGNRFLGRTRTFTLQLYSQEYILQHTRADTVWRIPAVAYAGPPYTFPRREAENESLPTNPIAYRRSDDDGDNTDN